MTMQTLPENRRRNMRATPGGDLEEQLVRSLFYHTFDIIERGQVFYDGSCFPDKGISGGRPMAKRSTIKNSAYQLGVCKRPRGPCSPACFSLVESTRVVLWIGKLDYLRVPHTFTG